LINFWQKRKRNFNRWFTKNQRRLFSKITKAIAGKSTIDESILDSLEEALVGADVGIETTIQIIDRIEKRVKEDKYINTSELNGLLQHEIQQVLIDADDVSYKNFDIPTGKNLM
jgi:fused signal recognition particle receptor